jgi:hypothetical protein
MKNYLIALFFAFGLASMQSASASELIFGPDPDGPSINLVNDQISGNFAKGFGEWDLNLDMASDVSFSIGCAFIGFKSNPSEYYTGTFSKILSAGSNAFFSFSKGPASFSIDASAPASAVPVPGAIWLFGSALAGLIGVTSRKSSSSIAVA